MATTAQRDTTAGLDDERRLAARLAGLSYLLAIVLSLFAEFYVLNQVVSPDAATTAGHLGRLQDLFRLGTGANLLTCLVDAVLIASLYRVLSGVSRLWALVALFLGLVETSILALAVANDLVALKLLGGAAYLGAIPAGELPSWARLALWGHGMLYSVALMFAGGRSTLFCWLWWRSALIPRLLAGLGVLASVWLFVCTFGAIVSADVAKLAPVEIYGAPIFLFELLAGAWLLLRGVQVRR